MSSAELILVLDTLECFASRSMQYGRQPLKVVEYESAIGDESVRSDFNERCLQMNRFLLDDTLPDNSRCGYQRNTYSLSYPAGVSRTRSFRENIECVVSFAFSVRVNQYFWDGNHRTSILAVFELLADVNILCNADPVAMYVILSNGGNEHDYEDVKVRVCELTKYIRRHSKIVPIVTYAQRVYNALNVKALWRWSSFFEEMSTHGDHHVHRTMKRKFPQRYAQCTRLKMERQTSLSTLAR